MTTLTNKHNGRTTEIECAFPFADFYKVKGKQERKLVCEKASTLAPEVHSPESITQSREIFDKMNESERLAVFRRIGVEETLSKLGMTTLELADPWDRSTPIRRNGKPA